MMQRAKGAMKYVNGYRVDILLSTFNGFDF